MNRSSSPGQQYPFDRVWRASKFERHRGKLRGSRTGGLGVASFLIADRVADFYESKLGLYARGRLLDLGCGSAPLYGTYRPLVDRAYLVDWPNSLHARTKLDVYQDVNRPLGFKDSSFDCVILSDVLEHVRVPEQLVAEISRVLSPEGVLIMNVPFMNAVHEAPHDYFRYTEFTLHDFMQGQGFKIEAFERFGGILDLVATLVASLLARIPLLGSVSARGVQAVAAMLGRTRLGAQISVRTSVWAQGYGLVAVKAPTDAAGS